jgi:hypothetical protein
MPSVVDNHMIDMEPHLLRRLKEMRKALDNLTHAADTAELLLNHNAKLRKALRECIARAGAPDPVEACRLVIRTAEETLGN